MASARAIMGKVKRKLANACHSEIARLDKDGRPSSKPNKRRKISAVVAEDAPGSENKEADDSVMEAAAEDMLIEED